MKVEKYISCLIFKRGSGPVEVIKYLPRCCMIAFLIDTKLQIFKFFDLTQYWETKKKISTFCINNSVYKNLEFPTSTDELCVATTDKQLFFFTLNSKTLKFEESNNKEGGFFVGDVPSTLCKIVYSFLRLGR